jgi:hypothetical protein
MALMPFDKSAIRADGFNAVRVRATGEIVHPECRTDAERLGQCLQVDWPQRCARCGGTITMKSDPATVLIGRVPQSKQTAPYRESCYICRDPEFAQMGLPLCRACPACGGHVAADDVVCDDCGHDATPEGLS